MTHYYRLKNGKHIEVNGKIPEGQSVKDEHGYTIRYDDIAEEISSPEIGLQDDGRYVFYHNGRKFEDKTFTEEGAKTIGLIGFLGLGMYGLAHLIKWIMEQI